MEEVIAIADRITVLRDGRYQGTWVTADTTISQIVVAMTGQRSLETFPERTPVSSAPVILDVRDVRAGAEIGPMSFRLRTGEILGLVGSRDLEWRIYSMAYSELSI